MATHENAPTSTADVGAFTRYYALIALFIAYTWNFVDRIIIGIVQEPIKHEFGLSDFQLGLLGGPAFSLVYVVLGFPFAYFADRYHRTTIISLAFAAWSLFTGLCGYATNFVQLLACRAGVGIGEAGCSPTSHSLIADYFPPEKRSFAFGVFASGVSVGSLLAGLASGALIANYGWRGTFIVLGVSGLILAVILKLTVREPARTSPASDAPPMLKTARYMLSRPLYVHIVLGTALAALMGYTASTYLTSFFIRTHGMQIREAASQIALIQGLAGAIGTYFGGYLGNRFMATKPYLAAVLTGTGFIIAMPLTIFGYLTENATLATITLMIGTAAQLMYFGPAYSFVHSIAQPRMRATAAALLLFIVNIISLTLGPPIVGLLSDDLNAWLSGTSALRGQLCSVSIFANACSNPIAGGLQLALTLFCFINIWAAFHFWRAARIVRANPPQGEHSQEAKLQSQPDVA